jgi:1-acyl-sn-glycerol-3-phosphate acyltransferase
VGCEKAAEGKAEDHLVRIAVSCGKLCAVGEIPIIPLKVCGTVYKLKYLYKHNMFTISHVNVSFGKKSIKFSKFFIHMVRINRTVAITQGK